MADITHSGSKTLFKDIIHAIQKTSSIEIALGNVSGYFHVNKHGDNTDLDVGTEDVWTAGGLWVAPTASRTHQIVSTSTDDDSGGTGALTIEIFGLDSNFDVQEETITMDGTTNVPTASTYTRIDTIHVITAGSGGSNAGVITATADTDSTVTAHVAIGNNHSEQAIYTIPNNKKGLMTNMSYAIDATSNAVVDIKLFEIHNYLNTIPVIVAYATHFLICIRIRSIYICIRIRSIEYSSFKSSNGTMSSIS